MFCYLISSLCYFNYELFLSKISSLFHKNSLFCSSNMFFQQSYFLHHVYAVWYILIVFAFMFVVVTIAFAQKFVDHLKDGFACDCVNGVLTKMNGNRYNSLNLVNAYLSISLKIFKQFVSIIQAKILIMLLIFFPFVEYIITRSYLQVFTCFKINKTIYIIHVYYR